MSQIREISSLPLAPSLIEKLVSNGFRVISDLNGMKPLDIAQELQVSNEVALTIIKSIDQTDDILSHTSDSYEVFSARDLLDRFGTQRPIITFCKAIDVMVGGGIACGQLTEICGVPGIGKTQMAIQLALNAQIPEVFNGSGGECVYIDTEGSFMAERCAEMAKELSHHLHKLAQLSIKQKTQEIYLAQQVAAENMTMERFLEGIHLFRVHEISELLSVLHHLPSFLAKKTKIKLIIIDSIAFPFRPKVYDIADRNRLLTEISSLCYSLCYDHKLAMVMINHVTTKVASSNSSSSVAPVTIGNNNHHNISHTNNSIGPPSRIAPALGEQWSHIITNRILLHWGDASQGSSGSSSGGSRYASLLKSPAMPTKTVEYTVNKKGIRDVPSSSSGSGEKRTRDQR